MRTRILITALGTVNAGAIIDSLKKYDSSIYIYGADINQKRNIVNSKYVDTYHVFPSSVDDSDKYLNFVLEFCQANKIDYIFSVIDEEVFNFSKNRMKFESIGTKLCVADYETIKTCHLKNCFSDWMSENFEEYMIKTYQYENLKSDNYPLFIKPIEGRASIGCRKIENKSDFTQHEINNRSKFILQEYIEGEIYVVDMVRSRKYNQFTCCIRKELLRNGNGCGIAVEIIDDKKIIEIARNISNKIDLNGVISMEIFKTKDGLFKVIEINPRLPAGTSYSILAGCDTVRYALEIAMDNKLSIQPTNTGMRFARRYETYEM